MQRLLTVALCIAHLALVLSGSCSTSSDSGCTSGAINITSTLTTLSASAFASKSGITSVSFSDCSKLVSIGLSTFLSNSIASITWPSSCNVVYIDYGAFYGNQLTSLDLSRCKISGFGSSSTYGVFQNNQIRTVKFGVSYLTSLPDNLFYSNKLISMNFTELPHLTYVGFQAFYLNLLTSLDFSDTHLTIIGTRAFAYNSLKSITWNSELTVINSGAFIGNAFTTLSFADATKLTYLLGDSTYGGCFQDNSLTEVNFADSIVSYIGYRSFYNNKINNVTFNKYLKSIETQAFYVNSISSVNLISSSELVYIGSGAFSTNKLTSSGCQSRLT